MFSVRRNASQATLLSPTSGVTLLVVVIAIMATLSSSSIGFSPYEPSTLRGSPHVAPTRTTPSHSSRESIPYRQLSLSPRPLASGVNPYLFHTAEPAPLGITDYGIDGAGNPYVYSTPAFVGQVQINSLSSDNASLGFSHGIGFQLNVNLYLQSGATVYVYWVQDVAILNSSSGHIVFEDNIWNSSAAGASHLTSSSVRGNGSLAVSGASTYYYDYASASLHGNQVFLSFPTNVTLEVVASVANGVPEVAFEYNDGSGWQTYDQAVFPSSKGFTDYGFVVDGFAYEPNGVYYDAELIAGGPGGGAQTTISSTNVLLFLDYWNGHNFQEIQNAFNFGSDTLEGLNNGLSSGLYYLKNGSLFADITSNAGSLGPIFDRTFVGIVNISTPVVSGELYVNGTDYGSFFGGEINVTIAPGTYTFTIYQNGALVASKLATIGRGLYVPLRIGFGALFSVTFLEAGLPSGTEWSVTLGSTTVGSTSPSIAFTEPNGSFSFSVGSVAGYSVSQGSGVVSVNGQSVTVNLEWTLKEFLVTFVESGLPPDTVWAVTLLGTTLSSSTSTIIFTEASGSYSYAIGSETGYRAAPSSGSVQVSDANVSVSIDWTQVTYAVWFNETGLPQGTPWQVSVQEGDVYLNGTYQQATTSLMLPNGSFAFSIDGPTAYTVLPSTGQITIAGGGRSITVVFSIREGRLIGGILPASATLWVGTGQAAITDGKFNLSLAPGTYAVEATSPGYHAFFTNVTISPAQETWLNVTLTASPNTSGSPLLGSSSLLLLGLVAAAIVGLAVALLVFRKRRKS